MEKKAIEECLRKQKEFFASGATLQVSYRKNALKRLLRAMEEKEQALAAALKLDLGKSFEESYMCEIGLAKTEIRHMIHHVDAYAKERRVHTPLAQQLARSFVKPVPYGSVLVMSPWNYPLLLSIEPLTDALAAGNTVIIKPSAYAPATAEVVQALIREVFPPEYVTVITGGREENASLLECNFDYIFFTGSKNVGREVMRRAAEHLTPVTLELGGKSPCIVDETADLALAARRIVFGKFLNCGQTCVAPDYVYCAESIRNKLIYEIKKQILRQFGENPLKNPNYGKMINRKHFSRVCGLMDPEKVVFGGETDEETLQISPTVLAGVIWEDAVMQEEIFGPVLPVLSYTNLTGAVKKINSMDAPLAAYIFSSSKENIQYVKERVSFGGGCINDVVIHLANSSMGFGGVGASGMGSYHGRRGFETFTHEKSMVDKKTLIDLPMRYQPYSRLGNQLVRIFLR